MTNTAGFISRLRQAAASFDEELPLFLSRTSSVPALRGPVAWGMGLDDNGLMVEAGGKRVRPAMALLASEALGISDEQAMTIALAIEMFHNFTLVHDDIEDGDRVRRGRPAVWVKYGQDVAINAGGYMHSLAFSLPGALSGLKVSDQRVGMVSALMAGVSCRTHIGQAIDIYSRRDRDFSLFSYYRLVLHKTGFCLAFPMTAATVLAGYSESVVAAVDRMGRRCGLLFQMLDDLIDLTPAKGREEIGSDLMEGKRSFLVALSRQNLSVSELSALYDILDTPREKTTPEMVSKAIALFSRGGVTERARLMLEGISEGIDRDLPTIPAELRDLFVSFRDYLLSRSR